MQYSNFEILLLKMLLLLFFTFITINQRKLSILHSKKKMLLLLFFTFIAINQRKLSILHSQNKGSRNI